MFVLDEIYVRGLKLINDCIWVGNISEILSKEKSRVLEDGPMFVAKIAKRQSTYRGQSTASVKVDAP